MKAAVSEIHAYPARPEGYVEPLFHTRQSRKEVMEHLARSPWLCRASELGTRVIEGRGVDDRRKAVPGSSRARVLASWREVDRWWEADGGVDVVWRLIQLESGRQTILAESLREAR